VIGEPDCLIGWPGLMLTLGAAAILIIFQPKQPQSPTMRSYLAIAVFFCLALCTLAATHDPLTTVFTSWVQTHQKSYSNEEFLYRWNVWRENHLYILKHNSENHTFALSMNHFGDLTTEEFNRLYNGVTFDFSSHILNAQSSSNVLDEEEKFNVSAVFDWRQKGAVTQVKNQGQCGSCWAFSATGATEGANFLKTGKLVSLSEQNLMDCSSSYGNHGCNGGIMNSAFKYIIANKGIDTESSYPYKAVQGPCRYNAANSGGSLVGFKDVTSGNEDALMKAASTEPVAVAIDASKSSFQFYKSGVYYDASCSSTKLNHGVLVAGWGSEGGQDYWLVKNSWGPSWGLQGYIKMARNKRNNCGIATGASFPQA